jgi:opacity protein-like surface antigen
MRKTEIFPALGDLSVSAVQSNFTVEAQRTRRDAGGKGLRDEGVKGLRDLGVSDLKFRISESLSPISYLLSPSPISDSTRYTLLTIIFYLTTVSLHAQRLDITDVNSQSPNEPGFDLRLALGGTVNTDMTVATRDGRSYPQQNINPLVGNCGFTGTVSYESVAFNPGFRFDFAPGYRLNEWIGFEFETGCIYNTVDSYTISGNGTFTGTGGNTTLNGTTTADAQGYLLQVPLIVNVELSYPLEGGWRPFVGAGGGGMFQKMTIGTLTGDIQVQGDFNQSNFMGAWEAFAGFGYQVAPGFDVSLAYRLNGVLAPDFAGYTMQNFFTQAAEFGMNWRF